MAEFEFRAQFEFKAQNSCGGNHEITNKLRPNFLNLLIEESVPSITLTSAMKKAKEKTNNFAIEKVKCRIGIWN